MTVGWRREPGHGRYAHPEDERRFLLARLPAGAANPREIVDRYVDGTRLRLRRVTAEGAEVYKLAQKVRAVADDPSAVMLTNIYLDREEYDRLLVLPAAELRKTRRWLQAGDCTLAVDTFHGALEGLVLAEHDGDELGERELPAVADLVADVTTDDRFSGGRLARTSAGELAKLLASFGLTASRG